MLTKVKLYINTIKYLKPIQITGQLCKRKKMQSFYGGRLPSFETIKQLQMFIPELDEEQEYLAKFNVEQLLNYEITLLNEKHNLDIQNWKICASPLWRFNLHYFEYCIPLGIAYKRTGKQIYFDKFKGYLESWIKANPVGQGDAWHPYTISMRIPNWLICLDLFKDALKDEKQFKEKLFESLYFQYKTLILRQETWQLGNHYLENLKTIVLCSILFCEDNIYKLFIKKFFEELDEEILSDGMHFELSPMYHRIILEDLIRVGFWLKQDRKIEYEKLALYIQKMANALFTLEKGVNRIPLFNDSGEGVAKTQCGLLKAVAGLFNVIAKDIGALPSAGYYKLYDSNLTVVIDAGEIGPSYMPGHGHCDCLSFELFLKGQPLFVNSGTYQYQGLYRKHFRSTAAHNTLTIENNEQSECWGEHRVARRIHGITAIFGDSSFIGEYQNFCGQKHKRCIGLKNNIFTVEDKVRAPVNALIHSYLHVSPEFKVEVETDAVLIFDKNNGNVCVIKPLNSRFFIHGDGNLTLYAKSFGCLEKTICIEFSWTCNEEQHGYKIIFNKGEL